MIVSIRSYPRSPADPLYPKLPIVLRPLGPDQRPLRRVQIRSQVRPYWSDQDDLFGAPNESRRTSRTVRPRWPTWPTTPADWPTARPRNRRDTGQRRRYPQSATLAVDNSAAMVPPWPVSAGDAGGNGNGPLLTFLREKKRDHHAHPNLCCLWPGLHCEPWCPAALRQRVPGGKGSLAPGAIHGCVYARAATQAMRHLRHPIHSRKERTTTPQGQDMLPCLPTRIRCKVDSTALHPTPRAAQAPLRSVWRVLPRHRPTPEKDLLRPVRPASTPRAGVATPASAESQGPDCRV